MLDLIVKISSKTVSRPEATRSHYKTTVLETRGTYSKPTEVELFIKKINSKSTRLRTSRVIYNLVITPGHSDFARLCIIKDVHPSLPVVPNSKCKSKKDESISIIS